MADPATITEDRRLVGLEACWEVDALCEVAQDLAGTLGVTEIPIERLHTMALKFRGLLCRIEQLNSAAMSVLDNDDDTPSLQRKVLGRLIDTEAAHG